MSAAQDILYRIATHGTDGVLKGSIKIWYGLGADDQILTEININVRKKLNQPDFNTDELIIYKDIRSENQDLKIQVRISSLEKFSKMQQYLNTVGIEVESARGHFFYFYLDLNDFLDFIA